MAPTSSARWTTAWCRRRVSSGNSHVDAHGFQHAIQLAWVQPDQESARSAIDVDARQLADGLLAVDGHGALQAKGRSAAHLVAGMPVRHLGRTRRHALAPDLAREILGRYFTIAVHE